MDHFKVLENIHNDRDAMVAYVTQLNIEDLGHLIQYLVCSKSKRSNSSRAYVARKRDETGVSPQWQHVMNNPDAYERKKAYNREYARQKRAERARCDNDIKNSG